MRYTDLFERKLPISDQRRHQLIQFLVSWLRGDYMDPESELDMQYWDDLNRLFPPRITQPKRLFRLVTLPVKFADMKVFHLPTPALREVGSWTSMHFGLESVHGITDDQPKKNTCRIAVMAKIEPQNIIASYQSLKKAFLSLAHDYDYDYEVDNIVVQDDGTQVHTSTFKPYLGSTDPLFHDDVSYYKSVFDDQPGGPLRQYEYIVRTTPLDVMNIRVYRKGTETFFSGHDDPHNSGNYKGWFKD